MSITFNEFFEYTFMLQVNKMAMEEMSDRRFLLRSTDPQRPELNFLLTTQTDEQQREWMDNISNILQTQNDFLKAIQNPITHQRLQESWVIYNFNHITASPLVKY